LEPKKANKIKMGSKIIRIVLPVLMLVAGLIVWPGDSLAATGEIYLSPASGSAQRGSNVTVALRINPGTAVNSVEATINYSSSRLQFVSAVFGSTFSQFQNTHTAGSVTLDGAKLGGTTSSNSLIANITFKALVGQGSTSLTLSGANAANNGTYTNPSTAGASISFTTPPASTSTSSSSSGTSISSSAQPTSPTATTQKTTASSSTKKHTATAVLTTHIQTLQYSEFGVKVSSNIPVRAAIKYGTSSNKLNSSTAFTTPNKNHTIVLKPGSLTPGTTYYYVIIAKDSKGNVTISHVKSISTKGFTLKVTVLDSNNRPLANKTVALHSMTMTAKTSGKGVATFNNVAPGPHHVTYTTGAKTYTEVVYVENKVTTKGNTQTADPQYAAVILTGYELAQDNSGKALPLVIPVLAAVIIIGAGLFIISRTPLGAKLKARLSPDRQLLKSAIAADTPLITPTQSKEATNAASSTADTTKDSSATEKPADNADDSSRPAVPPANN
jgi:hypothetical protein